MVILEMEKTFNRSSLSDYVYEEDNHTFGNTSHEKNETSVTVAENLAIACVAAVIICTTVCGNILVVVAVVTERRLRKVGNSFIVSLAVSDLLVGTVVTPFSIAYEVMGKWKLGHTLCDIWICLDVTCCTASIMNLCIISFDRYNAITQPLQYACKRTPTRACIMILGAWMYSVTIALPPLFGWREDSARTENACLISQDKGYTIFSTVGAFYLPLIVMFYLYGWVFRATLKRKREWVAGPGSSQVSVKMNKLRNEETTLVYDSSRKRSSDRNSLCLTSTPAPKKNKVNAVNPYVGYRLMQNGDTKIQSSNESLTTYVISPHRNSHLLQVDDCKPKRTSFGVISVTLDGSSTYDFSGDARRSADSILTYSKNAESKLHSAQTTELKPQDSVASHYTNHQSNGKALRTFRTAAIAINFAQSLPKKRKIISNIKTLFRKRTVEFDVDEPSGSSSNLEPEPSVLKRKVKKLIRPRKKLISVSQEKRAAKTLGIIMGCFVVCWLPFFVLAVLLPFCPQCYVHPAITSFFTWLGYCNSALNPIIYTFFNQDFRNAFGKLLRFRGTNSLRSCSKCTESSSSG